MRPPRTLRQPVNVSTTHHPAPPAPSAPPGDAAAAAPILRIGGAQPVDAAGCIVNPCAAERVGGPWREAVDALVAGCRAEFGTALHSVHLRGSVPRGLAVDGLSDLDAIVVVVEGTRPGTPTWRTALEQCVRQAHPGCRGVDLRLWPLPFLTGLPAGHPARFALKTQGLCVWGPDLPAAWPPVPLGQARTVLDALPQALARMRGALSQAPGADPALMRQRCRWLAKKIVRAGFELVAQHERAYTRDLVPCWEAFARHHPGHAAAMRQVLAMAVEPSAEPGRIRDAIALGAWVLAEDARSSGDRGPGADPQPSSISSPNS
jgi:hypothetical protein